MKMNTYVFWKPIHHQLNRQDMAVNQKWRSGSIDPLFPFGACFRNKVKILSGPDKNVFLKYY